MWRWVVWRVRRAPSRDLPGVGASQLVDATMSSLLVFFLLPLFGGDAGEVGVSWSGLEHLPKAAYTVPLTDRGPIVAIRRDGSVQLDYDLLEPAELRERLREIREASEKLDEMLRAHSPRPPRFRGVALIEADARADSGIVQGVVRTAQDLGWRVSLIVRSP